VAVLSALETVEVRGGEGAVYH